MTRTVRKGGRGSQRHPNVAYSREFLQRLARILVHSGHSPRKLVQEFAQVCKPLKEPKQPWDPARLTFVADLPHVMAHWHADPQYLDAQGTPIALPLRGQGPSLAELIARVLPRAPAAEVVNALLALRAIRRQGTRYRPTNRYLAFNHQRASALAHGLTALLGMLRTVEHNVSKPASQRLLERAAINPNFPVDALPLFHQRLKRLAADFLWSVDGDMHRKERRSRSSRTTRVGVGVFAFEDPLFTGTHRDRPSADRRRTGLTRSRAGNRP